MPGSRSIATWSAVFILTSICGFSAGAQSASPSVAIPTAARSNQVPPAPAITLKVLRPGKEAEAKPFVLTPEQQKSLQTAMDHHTCFYLRTYKFVPQSPGSTTLKPDGEVVCQSSTKSRMEGAGSQEKGSLVLAEAYQPVR